MNTCGLADLSGKILKEIVMYLPFRGMDKLLIITMLIEAKKKFYPFQGYLFYFAKSLFNQLQSNEALIVYCGIWNAKLSEFCNILPPSTIQSAPVTKLAKSDARNSTTDATSLG